MKEPTKEEVETLIQDGEAWDKENDKRVFIDPHTIKPTESLMPVRIPDIPVPFVEMARRIVANFEPGTFPDLERLESDAGDPYMHEVLKDLRRAARML